MAFPLKTNEEVSVPSKVVHFRNLPKQFSEDDLKKLSSPFGKVINLKCCVGPKRNQGFVEFEDMNEAISMVSHYSSSNRVKIRGKTLFVQYSDKQELAINKPDKGKILIVTMEGVQAGDVSIDSIHSVFCEFGFIQKISTFEKFGGFQALIQFSAIKAASSAMHALNGKSIPRNLLSDRVGDCNLRIEYSTLQDLTIKFQSNRTWDYTNPELPINQDSIDRAKQPPENRVLWASFENKQNDVTVDVLHRVFSEFGTVEKISIFEKHGQTHALIRYPDVATATTAKNALNGHCIYDGGYCKLRLSYSRHLDINVKGFSEKIRDYRPNDNVSVEQVPKAALENPHAASMNPSSSAHALQARAYGGQILSWNPIHGYMYAPAAATFPNQTYAVPSYPPPYALGQRIPMVHHEMIPPAVHVPAGFPPHMQPNFVGVLPPGVPPYYYTY